MNDGQSGQLDQIRKAFPQGELAQIVNQRASDRVEYTGYVGVAPYTDGSVSDKSAFVEVRAINLSSGGISLILSEVPQNEIIIVMLPSAEDVIFMQSKVVHQREGYWDRKRQFVVGCEFERRLWPE